MADTKPTAEQALRDLASAMRKMLPAPLLEQVIAHLDPLTPFVEFLRRMDSASTWLPIDRAPKDGTLILGALIRDGRVWRVHEMRHNGLAFYTAAGASLPQMTHWCPIPALPEAGR